MQIPQCKPTAFGDQQLLSQLEFLVDRNVIISLAVGMEFISFITFLFFDQIILFRRVRIRLPPPQNFKILHINY